MNYAVRLIQNGRSLRRSCRRWDIPMTEKRTSSARARSGFTLAELLIVTGIVSILVAVSIPIMSGQVQKAKEVRAKAEARILCTAL